MSERDGYDPGVPCWVYDTFQAGQSEITLCRVPGYGGGEPEQPVFWVDDVDRPAAKAAELGGWVGVSPFDTPISRDAVLADPQGAVFSVSKAA